MVLNSTFRFSLDYSQSCLHENTSPTTPPTTAPTGPPNNPPVTKPTTVPNKEPFFASWICFRNLETF